VSASLQKGVCSFLKLRSNFKKLQTLLKEMPMIDGIFHDTMADLNWTQVQQAVDQKALVLLPLGVIEEHGPHLCLGTDIYTAHIHCVLTKAKLAEKGFPVVIAPPLYWGICQSTGSFIGSFRMRKETVKAVLYDVLASLAAFGFTNLFGLNAHGDIDHHVAILETFKQIVETLHVNARFAFPQHLMPHYGLSGDEAYLCPVAPQAITVSAAAAPDVHAGDIETATIHQFYPQLSDAARAISLPAVELGNDQIWPWLMGGRTQSLSPDGYVGSPADFEKVDVTSNLTDIADRTSEAILGRIRFSG
jgi:creatinine amidohydrolase